MAARVVPTRAETQLWRVETDAVGVGAIAGAEQAAIGQPDHPGRTLGQRLDDEGQRQALAAQPVAGPMSLHEGRIGRVAHDA